MPVLPFSTYSDKEEIFDTITGFPNVYAKGMTPLAECRNKLLYGSIKNEDFPTKLGISESVINLSIIFKYFKSSFLRFSKNSTFLSPSYDFPAIIKVNFLPVLFKAIFAASIKILIPFQGAI